MLSQLASGLAALVALAIIAMGARYLFDPAPAAAGFGIPGRPGDGADAAAWLAVKAVRDIAVGIAIAVLVIVGARGPLADMLFAIAVIPLADGTIVLRAGGPRSIAFGVHWVTAGLILAVAVLLVV